MLITRRSLPVSLVAVALSACTTTPPQPPQPQPRPPVVMPPPVGPVAVPKPEPVAPPPPAPLMTPTSFGALPGWQHDDLREAWPAFNASCKALARKDEWKPPCAAAGAVNGADVGAVRQFFEAWFVLDLVRAADGADSGLITGYYEPMLRAARKRGGAFQTRCTGCRTTCSPSNWAACIRS
jgi:membrane-bound lytic murein transglycosylase A